jgi:hypothetical protein
MIDTAMDRVIHHLGNAAQIMQFYKGSTQELADAYNQVDAALKIVRRLHNGQEELRLHADTTGETNPSEEDGKASKEMEQATVPREMREFRSEYETPTRLHSEGTKERD